MRLILPLNTKKKVRAFFSDGGYAWACFTLWRDQKVEFGGNPQHVYPTWLIQIIDSEYDEVRVDMTVSPMTLRMCKAGREERHNASKQLRFLWSEFEKVVTLVRGLQDLFDLNEAVSTPQLRVFRVKVLAEG